MNNSIATSDPDARRRELVGALFVVVASAALLHALATQTARLHYHTAQTFLYLGKGWEAYLQKWHEPWVSRIGSTALSYRLTHAEGIQAFYSRVGWWVALWFVAVALMWLVAFRDWRHQMLAVLVNVVAIVFLLPLLRGQRRLALAVFGGAVPGKVVAKAITGWQPSLV